LFEYILYSNENLKKKMCLEIVIYFVFIKPNMICHEIEYENSISVGVSLIDAHAGVLGLLATKPARSKAEPENQLSLICGTSACHMALSRKALNVPGVWGPYFSAILPNFYLSEGGQSAVGSLLDHVLKR
jgi:ribulose kinase